MKEIKLTVGGKVYKKNKLTTGDWLKVLEIAEEATKAIDGESKLTNTDITMSRISFLADVFELSKEELINGADFSEAMEAYRAIDLELTSAFLGTPLKRTAVGGVEIAKPQE